MRKKSALGMMYLAAGIFSLAASTAIIIRIISIKMLPERLLHMMEGLLSGKNSIVYMDFLGMLLGIFAYSAIGLLLMLIGSATVRPKSMVAKLDNVCIYVLILLIGLQLWRVFDLVMLDGLVYLILLGLILSFTLLQPNMGGALSSSSFSGGAISRRRTFYVLLSIAGTVLLANFILSVYVVHRFSGQIVQ